MRFAITIVSFMRTCDPASYTTPGDYYDRENYTRNLIRLLGVLQKAHDNKPFCKSYISHCS